MENLNKLADKIVDIVAEWEAHSTSSFSGLKGEILELLEKELNE